MTDYFEGIAKFILFFVILLLLIFLELKLFLKQNKIVSSIVFCIAAVLVNTITIAAIDLAISYLIEIL